MAEREEALTHLPGYLAAATSADLEFAEIGGAGGGFAAQVAKTMAVGTVRVTQAGIGRASV